MKVINASYEIIDDIGEVLTKLERIGRTCYHSEDKITSDGESAKRFIQNIIKNGHESVIEHTSITVKFVCDRGISHEIVRHRLASFTQESTRYCNYADVEKYPYGLVVIKPCFLEDDSNDFRNWLQAMEDAEFWYIQTIKCGRKPEEARSVLPNSTATTLFVTANLREWRHILKLRCAEGAHPQIRELMVPLAKEFQEMIPIIFDDVLMEK